MGNEMASQDPRPTVRINGCTIMGKLRPASNLYPKALELFFGVRYAQAERFKPAVPVPLGSSTGKVDASKPGPACPFPAAPHKTSEDCLRVNITRPRRNSASSLPLPVVMFFHGGAFNFGNPLDSDMASFVARSDADVVSVSVTYRVGSLGFLPSEEQMDMNLGLKDQRLAMEWVRQWIGVFGGDGDDVTLMGVSAGAHSVGHHMLNPSPPPFRKAILESGSPTARSVFAASHPRTLSQLKAYRENLPTPPEQRQALDAVLHASLMVWAANQGSLCWAFQPIVDGPGGIIPDAPLKLWQQPSLRLPAAILTGFCSHEGAEFVPRKRPFRDFFAKLIPGIDLDALEAVYPHPAKPGSPYAGERGHLRRLYDAYGHYAYICPVFHTAHTASKAGGRVYLYEFAAVNNPNLRTASHCAHGGLVRPAPGAISGRDGLQSVAMEMHSRWAAFVASSDGNLGEQWPSFKTPFAEDGDGEGKGKLLVFGEGNDEACGGTRKGTAVKTRRVTEREKEVCRFWWARMELSQGMGAQR